MPIAIHDWTSYVAECRREGCPLEILTELEARSDWPESETYVSAHWQLEVVKRYMPFTHLEACVRAAHMPKAVILGVYPEKFTTAEALKIALDDPESFRLHAHTTFGVEVRDSITSLLKRLST